MSQANAAAVFCNPIIRHAAPAVSPRPAMPETVSPYDKGKLQPKLAMVKAAKDVPSKLAAVKAAKVKQENAAVPHITIPSTLSGPSLGPIGFLRLVNVTNGKPSSWMQRREEERFALQCYTTKYDMNEVHGVQEWQARYAARRELSPVKAATVPYTRGSAPTLDGFVAGMPHDLRRIVLDLLARERVAAEDYSAAVLAAAKSDDVREVGDMPSAWHMVKAASAQTIIDSCRETLRKLPL
jgi:hypothetical protein